MTKKALSRKEHTPVPPPLYIRRVRCYHSGGVGQEDDVRRGAHPGGDTPKQIEDRGSGHKGWDGTGNTWENPPTQPETAPPRRFPGGVDFRSRYLVFWGVDFDPSGAHFDLFREVARHGPKGGGDVGAVLALGAHTAKLRSAA